MACTRCGSDTPSNARFCAACGAPQTAAAVSEERKTVSVLFVDIVGSTQRADGAEHRHIKARRKAPRDDGEGSSRVVARDDEPLVLLPDRGSGHE